MKLFMRYAIFCLMLAAIGYGAFQILPATFGKAPAGGHGHGEEEGHAHGAEAATMSDAKAAAAGITLETAGPSTLRQALRVNGILQPNQEAMAQVTPRFPGIVRDVRKRVGDHVAKGDLLATVESNQSLTSYELKAPLAGTVLDRQVSLGEYASEQKPAFVVADLSTVWADFSVPRQDLKRVKVGDRVVIDPDDGGDPVDATVAYLSPVGASETQSALARAVVPNADGRLRPGMFVTGRVLLAETPVDIAVKLDAVQSFENRPVVFVRNGDKFEPRDVELGQRDGDRVEILFGLEAGDTYAARNSFVIKADIAKSTAAHEH